MIKQFSTIILTASIILAGGCATQPDKLSTVYVSPLEYKNYDCEQIVSEMNHVSKRTVALYRSLDKKATNDAIQMGVGLVLFWPALFFIEGGDGPEAQEYSSLKGNFEALRTAGVKKKCDFDDLPKSTEEIIKNATEQEKQEKQEERKQNN